MLRIIERRSLCISTTQIETHNPKNMEVGYSNKRITAEAGEGDSDNLGKSFSFQRMRCEAQLGSSPLETYLPPLNWNLAFIS
jgi:hypothetical protein